MNDRAALEICVAGHTNTGKTSLMRTLLRDAAFGEVDDRPGVTRRVESANIPLPGGERIRLFDTPGLEDAVALLDVMDALDASSESGSAPRRDAAHDRMRRFLADEAERDPRFRQEGFALAQAAASDLVLYVVDAREAVRARHRDELELLARCGKPVVPVLNFAAASDARTEEWRAQLARGGLHAVAVFDTVVFDPADERRLLQTMRILLPASQSVHLESLESARVSERMALCVAGCREVATLLIDAAASCVSAPAKEEALLREAADRLRAAVRDREQRSVDALLALHHFRPGDVLPDELPLTEGRWPVDLFSPEALRVYGLRSAGLVATGAAIGLTVDVALHGLSLGAGTAIGAAMGGLAGAVRVHGRRLLDRARGQSELRVDDGTLSVLLVRQLLLLSALAERGHAAIHPIELRTLAERGKQADFARGAGVPGGAGSAGGAGGAEAALARLAQERPVRGLLKRARTLSPEVPEGGGDPLRQRLIDDLAGRFAEVLRSRYTPEPSRASEARDRAQGD